ncbi:MAG: hypothetical protein PGN09_07740 [Sphingomonas fennica]
MTPLAPYLAAGGLFAVVAAGTGGYLFGKDVQRDRDRVAIEAERDDRRDAARSDERTLQIVTGTLGASLSAALSRSGQAAAPIIIGARDALQQSPLATDPRCAVPVIVRDGAAALHRAAERAADAADTAGAAAVRAAQPAPGG